MSVELEKIASEGMTALAEELEKFASENNLGFTRDEIDTAVNSEEMTKLANMLSILGREVSTKGSKTAGQVAGETAAKALTAFGVGLGLTTGIKASNSFSNSMTRRKFDKTLDDVKRMNSVIRDADPEKVERFANTIFRFAPTAAVDPNLLSSVLGQAVQYESIDPQTLKSLAELEARMTQNTAVNLKNFMA